MSATFEKTGTNQVKMRFTVDAKTFDEAMQKAYFKIRRRINVPGFRRGKAPRKVIENMYGEGVFYEEAVDIVFPDAYDQAIDECGLYPVDQPSVDIEEIGGGKDLVFTAEVTVKPEVELGEYKGLKAVKPSYPVSDEDVEAEIKRAAERVARKIDVTDRPAQNGDTVNIDYAGSIDGVAFDGGTAEKQDLELGSNTFIPGFEEQVVGMAIGEEKDITVSFPEDYGAADLAGKEAVFHIVLHSISYKEIPEIDDELAKDVSEYDTLEEYRTSIRERLEKSNQQRADNEFRSALIQQAVANATVEVPEVMVSKQLDYMMQEMQYRMMYQGIQMEQYLQFTGMTMDDLREQQRPAARDQVTTQLVVEAIQKAENITVSDEDVDAYLADMVTETRSLEDIKKDMGENEMDYIRGNLLNDKTMKFIVDSAIAEEPAEE